MSETLKDQVFENALEIVKTKFPELLGTTPQWPPFDKFKMAYTAMDASRLQFEKAVSDGQLTSTIVFLCNYIIALYTIAAVMGVDTRPLMAALHRKDMGLVEEIDLETLLALQNPLQPPKLEA